MNIIKLSYNIIIIKFIGIQYILNVVLALEEEEESLEWRQYKFCYDSFIYHV